MAQLVSDNSLLQRARKSAHLPLNRWATSSSIIGELCPRVCLLVPVVDLCTSLTIPMKICSIAPASVYLHVSVRIRQPLHPQAHCVALCSLTVCSTLLDSVTRNLLFLWQNLPRFRLHLRSKPCIHPLGACRWLNVAYIAGPFVVGNYFKYLCICGWETVRTSSHNSCVPYTTSGSCVVRLGPCPGCGLWRCPLRTRRS